MGNPFFPKLLHGRTTKRQKMVARWGPSFTLNGCGNSSFANTQVTVKVDGEVYASNASLNDKGELTVPFSPNAYNTLNYLNAMWRTGTVDVDLSEARNISGELDAPLSIVLKVVLWVSAAMLVLALIYVLIVFYALAISGAQLTLQGIAGILLGIGMAVDANVVIFERFREELREGRTPLNAVKFGFRNAGRAVLDSNVTTLIAAVVLLIFGTGTIKGFATTLMISVVASLFTAVLITRGLLILICKLGVNDRKLYTR